MIRPFDWRDFPTLHRHRERGICLDMSLELTRSMALVPVGALLSYVAPATGIYTFVATQEGNSHKVIGQFAYTPDSSNAQLTFLSPESALTAPHTMALLDHLAYQAGKHGAHNLLAEVNERSVVFDVMRKAGYAIYARQRIWKIDKTFQKNQTDSMLWRTATEQDSGSVRQLYTSLVPALVQQTEPSPWEQMNGLACYQEDELIGYVHLISGPNGILAQPILHPNIERVSEHLYEIVNLIPNRRSIPLYFVVRSHQAWLELYLTEMGAEAGPYQAVMVKRLAILRKATLPIRVPNTGLENVQPEIPIATFTPFGSEISSL